MAIVTQLQLLGLCVATLVIIAVFVASANAIVRFRSGLNNNDTLRRFWSKPDQIIFQPIRLPLVLSLIVGLGVNGLVRSIMVGFLQLVDALELAGDLPLSGHFAVSVAGTAAGSLASRALYIVDGGQLLWTQIVVMSFLAVFFGNLRLLEHEPVWVVIIWSLALAALVAASSIWISRYVGPRVPLSQVRDIRRTTTVSDAGQQVPWTQQVLDPIVSQLSAILPWLIDRGIERWILKRNLEHEYLAVVLKNFSRLMVLIGLSFHGIVAANMTLKSHSYVWQWSSCLAIIGVLGFLETFEAVSRRSEDSLLHLIDTATRHIFMYAAAGYLGAAVYLGVLSKAASRALDPGVEGQSELIVDEDDSEYEMEA